MPITAPPDYTKHLFPIAVGFGVALVVFSLTRNNLPHVGDNIHALPHGGRYRDGTKAIIYNSPQQKFPSSNLFGPGSNLATLFFVILLIATIHALSKRGGDNHSSGCNCSIHSPNN
jgi:ABC-type sugar transport system permease subunit